MAKNKRGFTLAETLVTLGVLGVISALVIPTVIKNLTSKANMTLLQSTLENISTEINAQMLKQKTSNVAATSICTNPSEFLSDISGSSGGSFASSYKSYNGGTEGGQYSSYRSSAAKGTLKNGTTVGIYNENNESGDGTTYIFVDLNGAKEPNIAGADYFMLELFRSDDTSKGIRSGDMGGATSMNLSDDETELETSCKSGDPAACYILAEKRSFAPDYLNQTKTTGTQKQ